MLSQYAHAFALHTLSARCSLYQRATVTIGRANDLLAIERVGVKSQAKMMAIYQTVPVQCVKRNDILWNFFADYCVFSLCNRCRMSLPISVNFILIKCSKLGSKIDCLQFFDEWIWNRSYRRLYFGCITTLEIAVHRFVWHQIRISFQMNRNLYRLICVVTASTIHCP